MHIHGNQWNLNAVNPYSAAAENAAARQRAAETRKKLLKSAAEIEGAATPEETLLNGQWLDSRHSQTESEDQYRASAAGRDSDFG
jgi:hypothetical protein